VRYLYIALAASAIVGLRLFVRQRRRQGRAHPLSLERFGDAGKVAMREITERVRGRIFRIGTLLILLAVAAAIIIPALTHNSGKTVQTVGVVGGLSAEATRIAEIAAATNQDTLKIVVVPTLDQATHDLRTGKIDLAIVDGNQILLNQPADARTSTADAGFVRALAAYLGVLNAYHAAGLTPEQLQLVQGARPVPVHTLEASSKEAKNATFVIGIVLLFVMLSQYNTWILIGVMQEKSSRVVEVLLATVRPIQLLGGKVLGIGLVAFGQAALIVGFALVLGKAVGSDLLKGAAPLVLLSELLWLVLGYAFYCWVYAAGGSTAERQDQVQTLALPLSIPILVGYIFSIAVASSGNAGTFFKVLAYFPPTAPFCMPTLVGLSDVSWWQFVASALITIAATVGMAIFASRIYRRAVLQTGGRVHIRELLFGAAK
jgi:ABC-2 type transport system permease protein